MKYPLGVRVDSSRRVWFFVLLVTLFTTGSSLVIMAVAFHLLHDGLSPLPYLIAGVVPLLVMAPVTYVLAQIAYKLTCAQEELLRLARTDELTGIFNRRAFFEQGNTMLQQVATDAVTVGLLLIDADDFKQVNDSFGHVAGDQALRFLAKTIQAAASPTDVVARIGGDEFAVLRYSATKSDMALLAATLHKTLARQYFFYQNDAIRLAISAGVADSTLVTTFDGLLLATDIALYHHKNERPVVDAALNHSGSHLILPATTWATATPSEQ